MLGPISVSVGGRDVAVTSDRDRTLLAVLLLHAGRTTPIPQLADAVWGAKPPRDARNQIQGCVSRLRGLLAGAGGSRQLIVTDPDGYHIALDHSDLDLAEFRRLRADARAATDRAVAASHYRAALALWRGPALLGVDSERVRHAAVALDEEHVQAIEERLDAELAAGRGDDLVPELTELVRDHPFREKLHAALMLALYRAGRQADALAAYRHARDHLQEELGAEPGYELERLHRAILEHDPGLRPDQPRAGGEPPVPRELPTPVMGFTGRAAALDALDTMLAAGSAGAPAPVVISAVTGTAGVGKTALAVHWAHHVADRFPDGQLYLNLRGYATGPALRPIEALAALLRSLGTPPEQIPTDEAQAASLYRTRLASRRVLILLDNARSAEQVRPLLPGSPGCLVLVTSRDRLSGLLAREGARRVSLDVLSAQEAAALLSHMLGPERMAAEPAAAASLAGACAYLPLALRIAAAALIDRPTTIGAYLGELTAGDRLTGLQAAGDRETAVRAAFEVSYLSVPEQAQRLFRLLGLIPAADVTPAAAGSLLDTPLPQARRLLDTLAAAHLIVEHATGRYAFHDLLRQYASDLAHRVDGPDRCAAATARVLDWLLQTAEAAATTVFPEWLPIPAAPGSAAAGPARSGPGFDDRAAALGWLDAERAGLVAAIDHAGEHGPRPFAWRLAHSLSGYLLTRRHHLDCLAAGTAALRAARRHGDKLGQASAEAGLGRLHLSTGRSTEAVRHLDRALALARAAGWLEGEYLALAGLGNAHKDLGQFALATDCFARALAACRNGGRLGPAHEAGPRNNLGVIDEECGRLTQAAEHYSRALALSRQVGSIGGEATTLHNLGVVSILLGRFGDAHGHLTTALALYDQIGHRSGIVASLDRLAVLRRDTAGPAGALPRAEANVSAAAELADPRIESLARSTLASVYLSLGRPADALAEYTRVVELATRARTRATEVEGRIGLAATELALGHCARAAEHASTAAGMAHELGNRVLAGQAMTVLARVHIELDRARESVGYATRALAAHRAAGHLLGQAHALAVLGHAERLAGDPLVARSHWRAARTTFTAIGARPPDDLP